MPDNRFPAVSGGGRSGGEGTRMSEDRLRVSVSGVRGTIGSTLSPRVACEFGSAFATFVGAGKTVVVARDTRRSGPMIRSAVTAGLLGGGVNVIDLGVVTTPGAALMTSRLKADGGVIITASHNPSAYNGMKFLRPSGTPLTAEAAGRVKEIWESGDFALADADHQGTERRETATHAEHVDAVCRICDEVGIAGKRFKVVLDSINGAGCVVTPMLLGRLGCEVAHINAEADGRFAHEPEPIAENLGSLCEAVRKHKAAVGFAQDPDADRLVLVDERGECLGEEYSLALAASFVLRHRKGKLATNLMTSRMIDDIAARAGVEVVRAPTGEANVVEAMEREGCMFGGEGNGGVIDPRVVPVRDSLVGMAMILQEMAERGKPLSELAADIPRYVMIKIKMLSPPGAADEAARRTREAFASREGVRFNDVDGLRIDLPEGWVCVRGSNTEPILRVAGEGRDAAVAQGLVDEVRKIAEEVIREM